MYEAMSDSPTQLVVGRAVYDAPSCGPVVQGTVVSVPRAAGGVPRAAGAVPVGPWADLGVSSAIGIAETELLRGQVRSHEHSERDSLEERKIRFMASLSRKERIKLYWRQTSCFRAYMQIPWRWRPSCTTICTVVVFVLCSWPLFLLSSHAFSAQPTRCGSAAATFTFRDVTQAGGEDGASPDQQAETVDATHHDHYHRPAHTYRVDNAQSGEPFLIIFAPSLLSLVGFDARDVRPATPPPSVPTPSPLPPPSLIMLNASVAPSPTPPTPPPHLPRLNSEGQAPATPLPSALRGRTPLLQMRLAGCEARLCHWHGSLAGAALTISQLADAMPAEPQRARTHELSDAPIAGRDGRPAGTQRFLTSWGERVTMVSVGARLPGRLFYLLSPTAGDATSAAAAEREWRLLSEAAGGVRALVDSRMAHAFTTCANQTLLSRADDGSSSYPLMLMLFATLALTDGIHANLGTFGLAVDRTGRLDSLAMSG